MNKEYEPREIENKWQTKWQESRIYQTKESSDKPKFYILDMFPYVSGEGIHVGHPKGYIATDIVSRMKRMQGFNVLHPMGFDAFGLPAENYAIKTKTNPVIAVAKNIDKYKKQLEMIGFDYDWSREVNTSDPNFYKWTQWIFLKLLEKGLAYESNEPVNWCPVDKTILANEDVEDGKCERCGSVVEKKPIRQWVLKITDYADRLLEDLEGLDWPKSIKESQKNWIGRSEGAEIVFKIKDQSEKVKVFTTRPDTIFGATYLVLAPEHEWVRDLAPFVKNYKEVEKYVNATKNKTDIERSAEGKEKTGVELKGVKAQNPATKEEIPVWVADYVLPHYGTGAIMGVPADDERDMVFAQKYGLPIVKDYKKAGFEDFGKKVTKYKLRDWVFSRQRYWGEPIPILRDGDKVIPLEEKDLPLKLPEVEFYEPTGTEESPLANISEWMNIKVGNKVLRRESNTMPQWAGSSWYYLRFMDPKNDQALVDKVKEKYWNQVDLYVGGAEHATRHLIYARFWHKFLFDIGVVSTKEPFKRLQHVGLIIAEDGRKMSKRWGNIINPDSIITTFGADTLRMYEMFMGPFDQSVSRSNESIVGIRRFLERVWRLGGRTLNTDSQGSTSENLMHQTIKKVTDDIETMNFNTAISALMIYSNALEKHRGIIQEEYETLLKLLAPFAPHISEELWQILGHKDSVHTQDWPIYNSKKIEKEEVVLAIQINGKIRASMTVLRDQSEEEIRKAALALPEVRKWLDKKEPKKIIIVPKKIISIVT